MVSQTVKETRVWSVLKTFGESVFVTLTTPDVVDYAEIRRRWRVFRHDYFRSLGCKVRWLMCFEPHPQGHGWHIHLVVEKRFLPVDDIRIYSTRAGFGRIHIERVFSENMAQYVGKYVTKVEKAVKARGCKRLRLLNVSRGLTRLSDIVVSSPKTDYCRKCLDTPTWETGKMTNVGIWRLAEMYLIFGSLLLGHEIKAWRRYRLECLSELGDLCARSELGFIEMGVIDNGKTIARYEL